MCGIELVQDKGTKPYPPEKRMGYKVSLKMRELGMLTRLGDVIAFLPPLASTTDQLQAMISIMKEAIAEVTVDFDGWLLKRLDAVKRDGLYRTLRTQETALKTKGQKRQTWASNDYLVCQR